MTVAIVCDSSADLPASLLEARGLRAAPIGYSLGASHHRQGEQSATDFYAAVAAGDRFTLSGVAEADWETVFKQAGAGVDDGIVCLCQAFGTSSPSFETAEFAQRQVEHFHEFKARVHQTPRSTACYAAITIALARVAASGASGDDVVAALGAVTPSADIFMLAPNVDTLDRAGELSAVESASGIGPLDFGVPVFRARDRIKAVSLEDNAEAAEDALIERAAAVLGDAASIVVVTHAQALEAAERLRAKAEAKLPCDELHVTELGPTVGGLLGAGAWGLGFCNAAPV